MHTSRLLWFERELRLIQHKRGGWFESERQGQRGHILECEWVVLMCSAEREQGREEKDEPLVSTNHGLFAMLVRVRVVEVDFVLRVVKQRHANISRDCEIVRNERSLAERNFALIALLNEACRGKRIELPQQKKKKKKQAMTRD